MVEAQDPDEVTLGTLHQELRETRGELAGILREMAGSMREMAGGLREMAGSLREMAGSLREMITTQQLVLDELRGVNTRLDRFARGRGDGAPPA